MARTRVHVSEADMDGAALRRLRVVSGLTQQELGEAIDMDASYIADMEDGGFPVTRPAALALRFVLDRSRA